jgi:pyridoxine 5-phosphate synthase
MNYLGKLRLGVNIDHVATVRNARGSAWPDPLRAALLAEMAGADGITAHLREDRRHIRDSDIAALKAGLGIPLNFECAATDEMQAIVLATRPHAVCLVPEKRTERTTEGGLDVAGDENRLAQFIAPLKAAGARVSLFIGHDPRQIEASARIGAAVVELHTGAYAHASGEQQAKEYMRLVTGARFGAHQYCEVMHGTLAHAVWFGGGVKLAVAAGPTRSRAMRKPMRLER